MATSKNKFSYPLKLLWAILLLLALAFGLSWVASHFHSAQDWLSFFAVLLIAGIILAGTWWLLRSEEPPRWLGLLLLGAVLLRLGVGAIWFVGLPVGGHGSPPEKAGYVMADAARRDQAAWNLAQSGKSLFSAFRGHRNVDQYGGLLFLSAFTYRLLQPQSHQPLLIVVLTAAVSSLAILFTWGFTRRAWNKKVAWLAAWILALYPEAVLLGSSQMREAFTVTLTIAAFYGLLRYQQERSWKDLAWVLVPLALYLPFSPPFAALLLAMLALLVLTTSTTLTRDLLHQRRLWLILGGMLILVAAGLWFTLIQFAPEGMYNPFAVVSWWIRKSTSLQAYISQHASGWMQKIFKSTPEEIHLPLLMAYGALQPFLPAALTVGSKALIWPAITLWRAVGWALMLPLLIYAPFLALRAKGKRTFTLALCLIVWSGILVAAFRGGGDMWDNPRYRQAFAGLQAALAAWAWLEQRRLKDPWFRRALIGIAAILVWFLPWYIRRYTPLTWPVVDLFKTLGLGIASAVLLVFWDWARTTNRSPNSNLSHPLIEE